MADQTTEYKGVKLGVLMTNKNGNKTIKLGSVQEGEYSKYNYTVQIRVLDANGNVVLKTDNPWVALKAPKQNPEKPKSKIEYELQVFKD